MEEPWTANIRTTRPNDGAFVREHFFSKYPELQAMVARHVRRRHLAPESRRPRPAQDLRCVSRRRSKHKGQPTVILAKTNQGLRHGQDRRRQEDHAPAEETGRRASCAQFRDRFALPISDDELAELPFFKPAEDSPEMKYLHARRQALGGYLPRASPEPRRR